MPAFKLQVQDDDARPEHWRDATTAEGLPLVFKSQLEAREKLAQLFPVLVKLEQFAADRKRTRVVVINPYDDIDNPKDE